VSASRKSLALVNIFVITPVREFLRLWGKGLFLINICYTKKIEEILFLSMAGDCTHIKILTLELNLAGYKWT